MTDEPDEAATAQPGDETPTAADPSLPALVGDLAAEVGTLVRQELVLAAREMGEKARFAGRNAIRIGVGALLCAAALLVLAVGLVLVLGSVVPMWCSALLIAAAIGAAGLTLFRRGVAALRSLDLLPTETLASLEDDGAWAREEVAATREQMSATLGEVRRRLAPPPAKKPRRRAPAKPKKSA